MSSKAKATATEFPESFGTARKNFAKNLTGLLSHLGYTAATLSLKINTICDSDTIATSDVYEWLAGTKIPSVYHLYKLSIWLHMPMDALFLNAFDPANVLGRSFAQQSIVYSVSKPEVASLKQAESTPNEENLMATAKTKNTVVSIARSTKKKMEEVVTSRTSSKTYNILLAGKLYSSEMQLKDISSKVGASTRSLRDYAFYGTTVPSGVAEALVKLFKTSYRNLGLQYNQNTDRYEHMSVKVKS